jgi:hemolysin III
MMLLELREPISAWSHGAGMIMAVALTWIFWQRCSRQLADGGSTAYERGKTVTMLIFGLSLVVCYGNSSLYHGVRLSGEPLMRLRRLDHVGIYLLIAGTYTPAAWSLMKAAWRRGTLASVWCVAAFCGARVWFGGILPTWTSTMIYLGMGWGVLFCYRELARNLGHRTLLALPLGGMFYSVGAIMNLSGRPVLWQGVFGPHELFHLFVIAGSACHVLFMLRVVVPARPPAGWLDANPSAHPTPRLSPFPPMLREPLTNRLGRYGARLSLQLGETLFRRPHFSRKASRQAGGVSGSGPAAVIPTAKP